MSQLVCVAEGAHPGRLTRGRVYDVAASDPARALVRVRDNGGRLRWYPSAVFAAPDFVPTRLVTFTLDDAIADPADDCVEVTLHLSDNTRRWLTFTTPTRLARTGDAYSLPEGVIVHAHLLLAHVIVLSSISADAIAAVLAYLDGQGELSACSQLLGTPRVVKDDTPSA